MKKIFAIAFVLTLLAVPAFAAGEYNSNDAPIVVPDGEPAAGETISVLSNNVEANIVSSATAFAATTAHTSGSKQFGTSSDSTKIYSSKFELGTTDLVAPTVSDTTSFTAWTQL